MEDQILQVDLTNAPLEIEEKKISKNAKEKQEKKYKKKIAQAQAVIVRAEEKEYSQVINQNDNPSKYLLVAHFGHGDENDQNNLLNYCVQAAGGDINSVINLTIFPGISYGHIELNSIQTAQKIMSVNKNLDNSDDIGGMASPNCANIEFLGSDNVSRVVVFFYTPLRDSDLKQSKQLDMPISDIAITGSIPGLYVYHDFISKDEEKLMLQQIDQQKWIKLLKRRVQHYGYEFKYESNNVDSSHQIGQLPTFCDPVLPKIQSILKTFKISAEIPDQSENMFPEMNVDELQNELIDEEIKVQEQYFNKFQMFNQLTLNDYAPGQGIPPHVDTHSPFEEIFACLSLNSGVTMHFKTPQDEHKDLYLLPRSLILFTGEVRYNWLHSIAQRKIDKVSTKFLKNEKIKGNIDIKNINQDTILKFRNRRVSLTFRKVREKALCQCKWPILCDSQNKLVSIQENQLTGEEGNAPVYQQNNHQPKFATKMEKEHVYDVYEKIAPHFSNTRYKPWPKVENFLREIEKGSFVADIGCGNGKYLGCNSEIFTVGTDRSFNLIDICKQKNATYQNFVADSLILPIRSQSIDRVISIAVIHHFSTDSLRIKAIEEIYRILRIGGQALIYVWAYEQEHKKFKEQDVFVKWNLQDSYTADKNKSQSLDDSQIQSNNSESGQQTSQMTSFIETAIQDKDKKTVVYHRYYHMFLKGEMENLINNNFKQRLYIKESFFDHANWVVVCEKSQ